MVLMPRTWGYAPVYGRRHPADVIQLSILGRGDGPRLSLEPNVITGSSSWEGRRGSKRERETGKPGPQRTMWRWSGAGFKDGRWGYQPRNAAAPRRWKRQGNNGLSSELPEGRQPC